MSTLKSEILPSMARRFLRKEAHANFDRSVRRFHKWMAAKNVLPLGLGPEDVESFFAKPFKKTVSPRTTKVYKRQLIVYLDWLWDKGHLDFDPKVLSIRNRRPLPDIAKRYLRSLEPTLKQSSRNGHSSNVSQFHDWLADSGVGHKRIKRARMELLFLALADQGLQPSTRRTCLCDIRRYLRWLAEHGELFADPEDLIRSSDMPKLPAYLPRPLSPEQDQTLQGRLAASSEPLWQALLLMRLTGLRIGELRRLVSDCLHTDLNGHVFLKVPLGKLDNERLVPVDERVVAIVDGLRKSELSGDSELLLSRNGKPIRMAAYGTALQEACQGIESSKKITSHRLRHTYATTMLSAGVSLTSLMRMLGHKDVRMTLRYAAITQETVREEYQAAQVQISFRYQEAIQRHDEATCFDPSKSLADVDHWIQAYLAHQPGTEKLSRSLQKRLRRIRDELVAANSNDE